MCGFEFMEAPDPRGEREHNRASKYYGKRGSEYFMSVTAMDITRKMTALRKGNGNLSI